MVKLSTSINLIALEKNEPFFTLFSLLCDETTDSLELSLELLSYSGLFFIKLLDESGSYSHLPPSNTFSWTKGNEKDYVFN